MKTTGCELRRVSSGETVIEFLLTRKRVKNINLRVQRDTTVQVSAPARVPVRTVDAFVLSKADFIRKAQQRLADAQPAVQALADGASVTILGQSREVVLMPSRREYGELEQDRLLLFVQSPERAQKVFTAWKKSCCEQLFPPYVRERFDATELRGSVFPSLRFREMTSRWGSCCKQKRAITLNTRLLEKPRVLIDYVILHELCHLLRADHSPAFYALLSRYMPDWAERRKALRG